MKKRPELTIEPAYDGLGTCTAEMVAESAEMHATGRSRGYFGYGHQFEEPSTPAVLYYRLPRAESMLEREGAPYWRYTGKPVSLDVSTPEAFYKHLNRLRHSDASWAMQPYGNPRHVFSCPGSFFLLEHNYIRYESRSKGVFIDYDRLVYTGEVVPIEPPASVVAAREMHWLGLSEGWKRGTTMPYTLTAEVLTA